MKSIGEYKLSEMLPHLNEVAISHGLNLSRVKEFNIAKKILANRLYQQ